MICIEGCSVFSDKIKSSSQPPKVFKIPNQFGALSSRKPVDQAICCAFSQNGQYFAWDLGLGYIGILTEEGCNIDLNNFEEAIRCCSRIIDCGETVSSLLFVPTMKNVAKFDKVSLLAVGLSKGPIKLFNILTGVLVNILFDHSMSVTDMTVGSDGSSLLVSCSLDKTLKVWDFEESGNMCLTMKGHKKSVKSCSFSPCNKNMIASVGNGREVIIWTLRDKRHVQSFYNLIGHRNDVTSCSWSPDGALLASASHDSTVIIWDVYKKQKLWTLGHHYPMPSSIYAGGANGYWVSCVAFSSDGKKVVTTCEDSKLRVWHLFDCEVSVDEVILDKPAYKCQFSPNSNFAIAGQTDGSVKVVYYKESQITSLSHLSRMMTRKNLSASDMQTLEKKIPLLLHQYITYKNL